MASYIKFELEDGTIVFVESAEPSRGSSGFLPSDRAKGDHPANQEAVPFVKSVDAVRKMAAELIQNMRSGFTEEPDEVSINFGLKAAVELGTLVVSRGGVEANYNVSLRWRKEKPDNEEKEEKKEKKVEARDKE